MNSGGKNIDLLNEIERLKEENARLKTMPHIASHVSSEQFARAIAVSKIGFYDWDILKNSVSYSEQMRRDWGIENSGPIEEALARIHPDDITNTKQLIESAITSGAHFRAVYRVLRPDQKQIWIEAQGEVSYGADGKPVRFFGTSVDISDQKNAEVRFAIEKQKFETLFYKSASPMVLFKGPKFEYEHYNAKYETLVPKRQLKGRSLLEALPELRGSEFPEIIKRVFETGVPVLTDEELATLQDPSTGEVEHRYFDSAISRIEDGDGRPYGVFVQATEVTDRVLARKKIEQALNARDTFLSVASHELKTPITGMSIQTQMIKRSLAKADANALAPERVTKLINQFDDGLKRMTHLVDDMLDISRIQAGKLQLSRSPIDIIALVRSVTDRYLEQLGRAQIKLSRQESEAQIEVNVDRFRVEQVIVNLLTNAIRYAPGSNVLISLEAKDERLQMIFQDNGPGIASVDRERIFEKFERLQSINDVGGMGLGLFIVKQIIEAHGGQIYLQDHAESGARFVIDLPLA